VATDGSAAICARTESDKRCGEAGYLHRLRDSDFQPWRSVRSVRLPTAGPRHDLANLAARYRDYVKPSELQSLARSLGLTRDSLAAFGIGWSVPDRAWSFPMVDPSGAVLGIRLRRPNGSKFAVRGGKEGLFIPAVESTDNRLLICEGPTDAAALLDLGFRSEVGRPSCTGDVKLLVDLVRQRHQAEVVIVADCDEPGQRGADNLASVLVAYVAAVRVIRPPDGIKDTRAWLQAGGDRQAVEQAIEAVPARRLTVQSRRVAQHGR